MMRTNVKLWCVAALALASSALAGLDAGQVAKGLLEALEVGIDNTVRQTSAPDGFFKDEAIKILLPDKLRPAVKVLDKIGASSLGEALVEKMNRAAEAAAPLAKDVFLGAIDKLTFQDAMAILKGKEDEATRFLRSAAGDDLKAAILPIVTRSVESVGALRAYDELLAKARGVPFLDKAGIDPADFDLNLYVTEKTVDGLFHVLGEEEKKIRQDPKARVTDLLGSVFGSLGG